MVIHWTMPGLKLVVDYLAIASILQQCTDECFRQLREVHVVIYRMRAMATCVILDLDNTLSHVEFFRVEWL